MKRYSVYPFLLIAFYLLFFACKKELSFENGQVAAGALQRDFNNNCLPPNIGGTYIAGKNFNDSNYIEVLVHISKPGIFIISSDSVNGYSFKGSGNIKDTGLVLVRIPGSGKPLTGGTNIVTIFFDSTFCTIPISVLAAGNLASFTLQGSPNACMNDTLSGGYVKGGTLDTSNKIKISVQVTTPGNYSVSTNKVNGYSFSGSGTFTSTGIQTITLTASGTPLNAGTDVFTVTAGTSTCTFSVTVLTAVTVTNNDHFPLTHNSFWVYDDLFHAGDSIKHTVIDTITINNRLYSIMKEEVKIVGPFLYYYRKAVDNYYEYCIADKYTGSFAFATPQYVDLNFLQENLSSGASWSSQEFSGNASFGQKLYLTYDFSCPNANASVVVNGKAFSNVYIIQLRPRIKSDFGGYGPTGELYTFYYAKGVGLVYEKQTKSGSITFTALELGLRSWQVN